MNIISTGKSTKYVISKYDVFTEKFLKKKSKALWDQNKTYTKEERDEALKYLARALDVDLATRQMLLYVLRFKRQHEKRLRSFVMSCIEHHAHPSLTLSNARMPQWIKDVEARLHTLPRLIEECRLEGRYQEDKTEEIWASLVQLLIAECHKQKRTPGPEDAKAVAAQVGIDDHQLLFKLWNRQKDSAMYKFKTIHMAGDVARDVLLALTQLEWKVVDLLLLYSSDFSLVCFQNKIQPLVTLYQLVIAHKIEESGGDPKEKWAKLVRKYSRKYLTSSSGIVLQRRWCELKQRVHNDIRERMRTGEHKVHPLLVEIAAKYQYIVREAPGDWQELVRNDKVYDVSDVEPAFDSSDDDSGSGEENTKRDTDSCKYADSGINDFSNTDSEDDRPLVIDESIAIKITPKLIADLNLDDKELEQTSIEPNNVSATPNDDQITDRNVNNSNISANPNDDQITNLKVNNLNVNSAIDEDKNKSDVNTSNNELDSQINRINDNESLIINDNNEDEKTKTNDDNNDSNHTKNATETDIVPIEDAMTAKTKQTKAEPVVDLLLNNDIDIEAELKKLDLKLLNHMKCVLSLGNKDANNKNHDHDKNKKVNDKKQYTKKIDGKHKHDKDPAKKVNKTVSSTKVRKSKAAKKKNTKSTKHDLKKTKVNPESTKVNTDSTNKDIDETNEAAKSLLENMDTNVEKTTENEDDKPNSIIATVYVCKLPDGKDLGHVILPAPLSKDNVTVSIKTDNGAISLDSAVVNDPTKEKDIQHPSNSLPLTTVENQSLVAINPLNETKKTSNEYKNLPNESIQSVPKGTQPVLTIHPLERANEYKEPVNKITESSSKQKQHMLTIHPLIETKRPINEYENPMNETIQPSQTSQPVLTIHSLNKTVSTSNEQTETETPPVLTLQFLETKRPSNECLIKESKVSDLDLLQKIDPAQTQTVIVFSDSEDESDNVPNNDTNEVDESNISGLNQVNASNISGNNQADESNISGINQDASNVSDINQVNEPKICGTNQENSPKTIHTNQESLSNAVGEKGYLNLDDVKKYLNNHSLDDILTKMGDMVVKKEVKAGKETGNRICESFICISDSDEDIAASKVELGNDNSKNIDNKEGTDEKHDQNNQVLNAIDEKNDEVLEMVGCRSNECAVINTKKNLSDKIIDLELSEENIVQTKDVLNVPNSEVFILPPNFLRSTLVETENKASSSNALKPSVKCSSTNVIPTAMVTSTNTNESDPKSIVRVRCKNVEIPPPLTLSQTSKVPNESQISTPISNKPQITEKKLSNVKIPTPNSNVVTMIVNDTIDKNVRDIAFKNDYDDVMSIDGATVNKTQKANKNKSSDKKTRKTKIYSETAGYSGLFKLKDRATKETVGMLCRIKEEKSLVNEVTQKIDKYLEKFKDSEDIEKRSEENSDKVKDTQSNKDKSDYYNIINKKLELESKKIKHDGFLKMMLENCQAKTLWTDGDKVKAEEGNSNDGSNAGAIDPKLIMDARVYLPKLDEVDTYNKNRRVDFSINTKRISKIGQKILNYKMKSDDPTRITDHTEPKSTAPIAVHIESEIAVALKNKIPANSKKREAEESAKSRKKPAKRKVIKLSERLINLTKRIKQERQLQKYMNSKEKNVLEKEKNATETIKSLADKIRNERQKQQLLDGKTSNIVQRIKFETDDDFDSIDDTSIDMNLHNNGESSNSSDNSDKNVTDKDSKLQSVLQETIQSMFGLHNNEEINYVLDDSDKNLKENDSTFQSVLQKTIENMNINDLENNVTNLDDNDCNDDLNRDEMYHSEGSEDMELETVANNTLILDSSKTLTNTQDTHTEIKKIPENREDILINKDKYTEKYLKPKNITKDNAETDKRRSISIKVESIGSENHNISHDISSDDDDLPIIRPNQVIKRRISSDEETNDKDIRKKRKRPKKVKNVKMEKITSDDKVRASKSDEELGLRIGNELLKESSAKDVELLKVAKDVVDIEKEFLKEVRSSNNVFSNTSNIEEMLKLCKPVRLCLERVKVSKDTDTQVRKVELPDRMNLKRHRAPTAHVAPIRAQQTDTDDDDGPEPPADGDATEADIGNLLQQLTKETAYEWQRIEDSVKPKRPKITDAERDQNDKKTDKNKRKNHEKKKQSAKDSDDEFDATLEWQRQKNINYKFFNFNPISKTMELDPHTRRRDNKYQRPNRKLGFLVKKAVVGDAKMQNDDVIDLDDINNDNTTNRNELQHAVDSIAVKEDKKVTSYKKSNEKVDQRKTNENKNEPASEEIKLTPIFTKINSDVETEMVIPGATETCVRLIPIATKVEINEKEPEEEEPPRPNIIKKCYTRKFKNFVQILPKEQSNSNIETIIQPSTSNYSDITLKDPIPSTSKISLGPNFISISDDSSEISELSQTISVKNTDNNITNNDDSSTLQSLITEHKMMKRNIEKSKRKSSNDSHLGLDNGGLAKPSSIMYPPIKTCDSIQQIDKDTNSTVKMMEIGPVTSSNVNENEEFNSNTENYPQITYVTSIPNTKNLDNDFNNVLRKDEKDNRIETRQSMPRIENVMSVESVGSNVIRMYNETNNTTVENEVTDMGLKIQNVRSLPHDNDDNDPVNSNDEYHDSDSDNLQIDDSFNYNEEIANMAKPSTSKDLANTTYKSNNISKKKAKASVITILKFNKGKPDINKELPKRLNILQRSIIIPVSKNEGSISTLTESNYGNVITGEISNFEMSNIKSMFALKPTLKNLKCDKHMGYKYNDLKQTIGNVGNIPKSIDNLTNNNKDCSNCNLKSEGNLKNNNYENNSLRTEDKIKVDDSKIHAKDSLILRCEKRLESDVQNSITTENSEENLSKCEENQNYSKPNDTEKTEAKVEKTKTFLKVVPIQKLMGKPLNTDNEMAMGGVRRDSVTDEVKPRGEAMPFHCLSDEECGQNVANESTNEDDAVGSLPVISKVMSLSHLATKKKANQPSKSKRPVVGNKMDVITTANVWNPGKTDAQNVLSPLLEFSELSLLSPVSVAEFIRDRDCTNISLLCVDEWRPLWIINGEYLMLTNLKLPIIKPSYWTVGPRVLQCTRVLMDDAVTGSTIVGALSVPDEVFLENNWYKKLSTDPMIYAKIWYVVPNVKTCTEMMNCNVQMHLYSRATGSIMPLAILNQDTAPKLTQFKINTQNVNSVKLPELATLIYTTLKESQTKVVEGSKETVSETVKPVSGDEVINLDSDDE